MKIKKLAIQQLQFTTVETFIAGIESDENFINNSLTEFTNTTGLITLEDRSIISDTFNYIFSNKEQKNQNTGILVNSIFDIGSEELKKAIRKKRAEIKLKLAIDLVRKTPTVNKLIDLIDSLSENNFLSIDENLEGNGIIDYIFPSTENCSALIFGIKIKTERKKIHEIAGTLVHEAFHSFELSSILHGSQQIIQGIPSNTNHTASILMIEANGHAAQFRFYLEAIKLGYITKLEYDEIQTEKRKAMEYSYKFLLNNNIPLQDMELGFSYLTKNDVTEEDVNKALTERDYEDLDEVYTQERLSSLSCIF